MALMVNGHYLAVLSVSVQDNQSESEAINKIKDIVKNMYAVVSPQTPLKIGRKPWDTNEQVWKFYAISKGNNLYSGLAKTLLIDKNIPKTKDLEKQFAATFFDKVIIQIDPILNDEQLETAASELM